MIPNYKDIVDLVKKGSTLEAQEKIMELREAAMELQEENIQLRQRINELEEMLKTQENVKWEKPYYWVVHGKEKDGPFCQHCYDKEKLLVRLQGRENGLWHCTSCKNHYTDSSYIPPNPNRSSGGHWMGY